MENRRADLRIPESLRVTLTIESAPDDPGIEGRSFECRSSDVSLRGVRLASESPLPANTKVRVAVVLAGDDRTYRHQGRIVWCRPQPADAPEGGEGHYIGIEFNLSASPELDTWRAAILRMFERGLHRV